MPSHGSFEIVLRFLCLLTISFTFNMKILPFGTPISDRFRAFRASATLNLSFSCYAVVNLRIARNFSSGCFPRKNVSLGDSLYMITLTKNKVKCFFRLFQIFLNFFGFSGKIAQRRLPAGAAAFPSGRTRRFLLFFSAAIFIYKILSRMLSTIV